MLLRAMYVCMCMRERWEKRERERERERELVLLTQEIHSMIALVNLFLRFFGNVIFIFREKREAKKVFKYFHELVLSKCPLSLIPILGSCWKFEKNHFSIFVCTTFQKERTNDSTTAAAAVVVWGGARCRNGECLNSTKIKCRVSTMRLKLSWADLSKRIITFAQHLIWQTIGISLTL